MNPFYHHLAEEIVRYAFLNDYSVFQCCTGDDIQGLVLLAKGEACRNTCKNPDRSFYR